MAKGRAEQKGFLFPCCQTVTLGALCLQSEAFPLIFKSNPSFEFRNPSEGAREGMYGRCLGTPSAKQLSELSWSLGACAGSREAGSSAKSSDLTGSGEGSTQ